MNPAWCDHELDADILAAARRGEREALGLLYRQLAPPALELARRLLQDQALAEEVLQEAFIDVFARLGRLRRDAALGSWIRRIVVNRCMSVLRSPWQRRRHRLEALSAAEEPRAEPAECGDHARLEAAVRQLKPVARAVLWLHDVEGMTHREIAAVMGRSQSFSKSQLARAHERLRQLLDASGTKEGPTCIPAQNPC